MSTWENTFDELTHEIDPKTLKTQLVKSNLSFARKYCRTMPELLMETCLESIQQALSFGAIHQEQKTRAILGIMDTLPFILHLANQTVTTATAAEKRSAQLCFLLTRALATEENIIFNTKAAVIGHENTEVEQAIRDGYTTYRADPRSQQTVPQRIVAAINASIPDWGYPHTFAHSDRLEEWFTRFNLWNAEVVAIVWCVAMVCGTDPDLQREGYFPYVLHLWAYRERNQQSRKHYDVKAFLSFTPVSERWVTLDDYETSFIKRYAYPGG